MSINPTCQECGGECCKILLIPVGVPTPENLPWFNARGQIYADGMWRIESRCPHLNADNRCDIYETRPQGCRDWPVKIGLCNRVRKVYTP